MLCAQRAQNKSKRKREKDRRACIGRGLYKGACLLGTSIAAAAVPQKHPKTSRKVLKDEDGSVCVHEKALAITRMHKWVTSPTSECAVAVH